MLKTGMYQNKQNNLRKTQVCVKINKMFYGKNGCVTQYTKYTLFSREVAWEWKEKFLHDNVSIYAVVPTKLNSQ